MTRFLSIGWIALLAAIIVLGIILDNIFGKMLLGTGAAGLGAAAFAYFQRLTNDNRTAGDDGANG